MAESPDWRARLDDARKRTVFEPTPSGAKPYALKLDAWAQALDSVEVAKTALPQDSPGHIVAYVTALVLREMINARLYAENLRTRLETRPDNVDRLIAEVDDFKTVVQQLINAVAERGKK